MRGAGLEGGEGEARGWREGRCGAHEAARGRPRRVLGQARPLAALGLHRVQERGAHPALRVPHLVGARAGVRGRVGGRGSLGPGFGSGTGLGPGLAAHAWMWPSACVVEAASSPSATATHLVSGRVRVTVGARAGARARAGVRFRPARQTGTGGSSCVHSAGRTCFARQERAPTPEQMVDNISDGERERERARCRCEGCEATSNHVRCTPPRSAARRGAARRGASHTSPPPRRSQRRS